MTRSKTSRIAIVMSCTILAASIPAFMAAPAHASLVGQLGILDTSGTNPTTGLPWAAGDQYRFAFHTSEQWNTAATSTDINFYNNLVQTAANASPLNIGAPAGVTWNVIGSTARQDREALVASAGRLVIRRPQAKQAISPLNGCTA